MISHLAATNWETIKRVEKKEQNRIFKECLSQHSLLFRKVAYTFAEEADRNDLLQEILLGLWKAIPSFKGGSKMSTYAYRVAYNCALSWNRSRSRRRHREALTAEDGQWQLAAEAEPDPRLILLLESIRELPATDRSIVTMSLDGLSHTEIGQVLGLKENAISVRLHRIRKSLSKIMQSKEKTYE